VSLRIVKVIKLSQVKLDQTNSTTIKLGAFVNLVKPGIVPFSLGAFSFDTLDPVAFSLSPVFPSTAQKITVSVFIRSGLNSGETHVNVWLYTECSQNGVTDAKYMRSYRYHQSAYAFNTDMLQFIYCSSKPELYVLTDNLASNVRLELYAVGYTNV
jgi:hypothetical protein